MNKQITPEINYMNEQDGTIQIETSPISKALEESYKFQKLAWIYIFVGLIINFVLILFLAIK